MGLSGEWIGDYFGTGWGDFNNDGAIDLFCAGHIDKYRLFRNDNCPGNYLLVKLIGTTSNYNAIGARVKIWCGSECITRFVIAGEGMHCFHSLPVEFGLGTNTGIDSLEVKWPSGYIQTLGALSANQIITITEGAQYTEEHQYKNSLSHTSICQVHPNPLKKRTYIKLQTLDGTCGTDNMSLKIYDISGRLVKNLMPPSFLPAVLLWERKDNQNKTVRAGIYFLKFSAETHKEIKKLIVIE